MLKICVFFTVVWFVTSNALAGMELSPEQKLKDAEVKVFDKAVQKLKGAPTLEKFFESLSGDLKPAAINELKALAGTDISKPLQVEELGERRVMLDVGGQQATFEFLRTLNEKTTVYRINSFEYTYKLGTPLSEVAAKIKSLLPQAQSTGVWSVVFGQAAFAQAQESWFGRTSLGGAIVSFIGTRMANVIGQVVTSGCPSLQDAIANCEKDSANGATTPTRLQDMRLAHYANLARNPGYNVTCSRQAREESLRRFKICIHHLRRDVYQIPISSLDRNIQAPYIDAEAHARQAVEAASRQQRETSTSSRVAP